MKSKFRWNEKLNPQHFWDTSINKELVDDMDFTDKETLFHPNGKRYDDVIASLINIVNELIELGESKELNTLVPTFLHEVNIYKHHPNARSIIETKFYTMTNLLEDLVDKYDR